MGVLKCVALMLVGLATCGLCVCYWQLRIYSMCGCLWQVIYYCGFELFHHGVCAGNSSGEITGVMMLFNVLLSLNHYISYILTYMATADDSVCASTWVPRKLWNITQSTLCRVHLNTFPFPHKPILIDQAPLTLQYHQKLGTGFSSLHYSPSLFFTVHMENTFFF